MGFAVKRLAATLMILGCAQVTHAQTADEVIEKSIAAMGGRAAFAKLKSRHMSGTIVLQTPAGDVEGTVEVSNAPPNKTRTVIKADLTALGAGQMVIDQRFDGVNGYVMDSLQGNREITGNQLDNMRNAGFPHLYTQYKSLGISAKLTGKETIAGRDAYAIAFEPTTGSVLRQFIDAETYLPVRATIKAMVPQLGTEIEQTSDISDYHDVDGVKIPFVLKVSSSVQSFTITIAKAEHNTPLDDKQFSKP